MRLLVILNEGLFFLSPSVGGLGSSKLIAGLSLEPETWSPILQEAVQKAELGVIPYDLNVGYDYWTYRRESLYCLRPLSPV